MLAVDVWSGVLCNSTVIIHTDNLPIRHCIENQSSKEKLVMSLIRQLVLLTLKFRINLRARHIAGTDNRLADALSRLRVQLFKVLLPAADAEPTPVPDLLTWMSCKNSQLS